MHKLVRSKPGLSVLDEAKSSGGDWSSFHDREDVQLELTVMQDNRCAYCECALEMGRGHIEHFRRKNAEWFPELTFEWSNLFYSCMRNGSCGSHKDRVLERDQIDLLIDPCADNPEDYLIFLPNGNVAPRTDLSGQDRARAELTISVFNLRHPDLVRERANELRKYKWMIDSGLSAADIDSLLGSSHIRQYITAVYHYFGRRVVP